MVVATDTVAEDVASGFISVCADPGVSENIDLELVATLDANDIKASKCSWSDWSYSGELKWCVSDFKTCIKHDWDGTVS